MLETVKEEIMRQNFDLMEIFLLLDERYDINFSNMKSSTYKNISSLPKEAILCTIYLCNIFQPFLQAIERIKRKNSIIFFF